MVKQEWWRKRYERNLWHKWALERLVEDRRSIVTTFVGSDRWPIVVRGNRIYKIRMHGRYRFPSEPVGRFHGKHLVLHKKLAPRWLKNWAKFQRGVFILDDLDRGTLAAHLMKEKLEGAS